MRAELKDAEFMPTALVRCCRPTSSLMNDCRVGWSSALMMPHMTAITATRPVARVAAPDEQRRG